MRTLHITFNFRSHVSDTSAGFVLQQAGKMIACVAPWNPLLKNWFLQGGSVEEASLYPVTDSSGEPSNAAVAVLTEEFKRDDSHIRLLGVWNGETGLSGAHASYSHSGKEGGKDAFNVFVKNALVPKDTRTVIESVRTLALAFDAKFLTAASSAYDRVFKDRPGVGWMLYLPQVLTVQQVPEARALVPVMTEDGKKSKPVQIGTIIVSVTDEPFSDENPEHVKIAHAIEIRLVDQDLLPRYAEL